jgi:hypothetical protein
MVIVVRTSDRISQAVAGHGSHVVRWKLGEIGGGTAIETRKKATVGIDYLFWSAEFGWDEITSSVGMKSPRLNLVRVFERLELAGKRLVASRATLINARVLTRSTAWSDPVRQRRRQGRKVAR